MAFNATVGSFNGIYLEMSSFTSVQFPALTEIILPPLSISSALTLSNLQNLTDVRFPLFNPSGEFGRVVSINFCPALETLTFPALTQGVMFKVLCSVWF